MMLKPAETSTYFFRAPSLPEQFVQYGKIGCGDFILISKRGTNALSFYRSQNVFCWSKCFEPAQNLTAFSASSKPFVPAQKPILLNGNHLFVWHKMFVTATICQ